ncbi:hypothetical protein GN958_ATG07567 [Phytophthora infestans]|uniref:Uncharacterized protein n=1 Tax=Phytophthora infestans TaxID=4787 RepID=A0A8S9UQN0_PHYIN|nr:hypothetical protein GN958_ATG07566 [Phytophthora infestans]KAF4143206.1 hypothetical protein GN958_ATG07567 [Phytophthora infestans]
MMKQPCLSRSVKCMYMCAGSGSSPEPSPAAGLQISSWGLGHPLHDLHFAGFTGVVIVIGWERGEEIHLCQAQVNVTEDQAIGTDQSMATFWGRVHAIVELEGGATSRNTYALRPTGQA